MFFNMSIRDWYCHNCKIHHDRDINAAINIHKVGASTFGVEGSDLLRQAPLVDTTIYPVAWDLRIPHALAGEYVNHLFDPNPKTRKHRKSEINSGIGVRCYFVAKNLMLKLTTTILIVTVPYMILRK